MEYITYRNDIQNNKYYHIKNMHIFIGSFYARDDIQKRLAWITHTKHQVIHIFDLNPLSIQTLLKDVIVGMTSDSKLILHVYSKMSDYKVYLEHQLSDESFEGRDKLWKIVLDNKPVLFPLIHKKSSFECNLKISYTYKAGFHLESMIIEEHQHFNSSDFYYGKDGAVDTLLKVRNLELFKYIIIERFKKITPEGILGTFRDDEDIWSYILEENDFYNTK